MVGILGKADHARESSGDFASTVIATRGLLLVSAPESSSAQTVLFTYFELSGWRGKWFAFRNMGLGVERLGKPEGMEWLKLLGSGSANGFGLWPNWGGYALLAAFPSEVLAKAALASPLWKAYQSHAASAKTFVLQPLQVHGAWDGVNPFRTSDAEYNRDDETVVLTRARIHNRHLPAFWSRVRKVSESIADFPERTFAVGVGELPVIQQATVSHWTSGRAMEAYAYSSKYHSEVVRLTREEGWYTEELFCRFGVVEIVASQALP